MPCNYGIFCSFDGFLHLFTLCTVYDTSLAISGTDDDLFPTCVIKLAAHMHIFPLLRSVSPGRSFHSSDETGLGSQK